MKKMLRSVWSCLVFFCLTAFIVSCCMMLFLSTFANTMGIVFTEENLELAAKQTFGNVVLLSVIFTAVDGIRRRLAVDRPVKRITEAAEKMTKGDFSVRIPKTKDIMPDDTFNRIIDCFNKMAQELSGIETLREDFVSNVSHEIKTPLAVIKNYSVLIADEDLSVEQRTEYAKAIGSATEKLNGLVTNILKLNKLENQQIFPKGERYDLGEQLCECLLDFEARWEEKNIMIKTDIEENVTAHTDREMMGIVWNNLFSNAIKFTPAGGCISVSLRSENGEAIVSIKDSGIGISREIGEKIFDKFYRGDTFHTEQGNGLGLALVRRIIDITDSEISVESEPGKGSIFTVRMKV